MKKKSYNYKFVIGIIIGLIAVSGVSAATMLASSVYYENEDTNVQSAIDYLAENLVSTTCPDGKYCVKTPLSLGDYVSYTPTVTSYTVDTSITGAIGTEATINPRELNLWRVLNINDDGTVDIISEYVSSTAVWFHGKAGYLNLVGYLNVLASQYENSTYTVGSRHFGYNRYKSQTQYLDPAKVQFTNPPPFTSSTSNNNNEAQGGGDTLYLEDYNKVKSVLGTAVAYKVGTTTATSYWMASRFYYYDSSYLIWYVRLVNTSGYPSNANLYYYDRDSDNGINYPSRDSYALRPIVTLKSGLQYTGEGTSGSPWKISVS